MKSKFTKLVGGVFLSLFMVPSTALADWTDIKVDLTNQNMLSDEEKAGIVAEPPTFKQWDGVNGGDYIGVAVAGDASVSRVDKDAANAACKIKGNWHSNNYGWANLEIVVAVEGPVKITYGLGDFSGDVTVKVGTTEVATMNIQGTTWDSSHPERVASCYYTGDAATLTISGGSYQTYFAIESTAYVPDNKTATFSLGESGAEGVVPEAVIKDIKTTDVSFTIPVNRAVYKEGYTLTAWNDGSNDYAIGATYTIADNVTLTPVFTANTKTLDDRTAETTVTWDFQRKNGAPSVSWEAATGDGHVWVAPATIAGQNVDIKMAVDANPGKFHNASWTDWCQLNGSTTLTIPAVKGMTINVLSMGNQTTTFGGDTEYTGYGTSNDVTYTYYGTATTIDIVIGDGSYFRTVTAVYPAPTVDITIGSTGWATYCSGKILDFTGKTDIEAYIVTGATGTALNKTKVTGSVPAGTGLLVKGDPDTYTLPVTVTATFDTAGNKMVGYADNESVNLELTTTETGKTIYVLAKSGDDAVFKYWEGDFTLTIVPGRAYLKLDGDPVTTARFFSLDDEVTGIDSVTRELLTGKMYNLQGQEVRNAKGIVIVNGKKVVLK